MSHDDDRIEELRRLVRNARIDVETSERALQAHARGLHLARTILAQREQKLEELRQLIAAERGSQPA